MTWLDLVIPLSHDRLGNADWLLQVYVSSHACNERSERGMSV